MNRKKKCSSLPNYKRFFLPGGFVGGFFAHPGTYFTLTILIGQKFWWRWIFLLLFLFRFFSLQIRKWTIHDTRRAIIVWEQIACTLIDVITCLPGWGTVYVCAIILNKYINIDRAPESIHFMSSACGVYLLMIRQSQSGKLHHFRYEFWPTSRNKYFLKLIYGIIELLKWKDEALMSHHKLSLKKELARRKQCTTLKELITESIEVDNLLSVLKKSSSIKYQNIYSVHTSGHRTT